MDVCPSCRRAVVEPRGPCPHCGATLREGGATPQDGSPSSRAFDLSAELPDLVIAPPAPAAAYPVPPNPPTSSASNPVSSGVALPDFGGGRELDDDDDFDLSQIEVVGHELGKRPLPAPLTKTSAAPSMEPIRAAAPAEPPAELDIYDVLAFADYGPIPQQPWQSPPYAVRVLLRQRQIRRSLARLKVELRQLEGGRDDALVALFERTRPALEAHEDGARLLAPIGEIEARARARGEALESTSAECAAKVAEVDREIGALDGTRFVEATKRAELAAVAEREAAELSRAEAKQKRVEIEIRATQQAARAAAGPDATVAPPPFAAKLSALAEERDARAAEVARARGQLDAANGPLAEQQRVVAGYERRITDLRKGRKALEESYRRQMSVRSEGLSEVEKERRAAMVEVARRLLSYSRIPVDEGARAAVGSADEAIGRGEAQLEKHLRALDAYDKRRLKEGLAIAGAGLALLLVVLALLGGMVRGEPG